MPAKSKRKGKLGEREVVTLAKSHGLKATRTWETAQSLDATERACDVEIGGLRAQVKLQARGFEALYRALEGVDIAFVRNDRREWLVVLRAERFLASHGKVGFTKGGFCRESYIQKGYMFPRTAKASEAADNKCPLCGLGPPVRPCGPPEVVP